MKILIHEYAKHKVKRQEVNNIKVTKPALVTKIVKTK